jgi:hypothetical protein
MSTFPAAWRRAAATMVLGAGLGLSPAAAENLMVGTGGGILADTPSLMAPVASITGDVGTGRSAISQNGIGNFADSSVTGAGNLSLIAQEGSNNRAIQTIEGANTALLLAQGGSNNSVLQASKGDNNFQAVAVSGSNNDIAYIQAGNNLGGILDVRNAQNSSVVALQTNQSAGFLMPSGISGLKNQMVVVVPGRMYGLPKN